MDPRAELQADGDALLDRMQAPGSRNKMQSAFDALDKPHTSLLRVAVTLYVEAGVDEKAEDVIARTKDRLNSEIVRAAVGHTIARVEVSESCKPLSRGPVPSR